MPPTYNNTQPTQPAVPPSTSIDLATGQVGVPNMPTQPIKVANPVAQTKRAAEKAAASSNDVLLQQTITKAKHIVSQTGDDPFQQVQQIETLKASYMQARFGRTLKVSDV